MALAKTIGVLLVLGVILWLFFAVIGIVAATLWTIIKFLILMVVVALIYHHFKRQRTDRA